VFKYVVFESGNMKNTLTRRNFIANMGLVGLTALTGCNSMPSPKELGYQVFRGNETRNQASISELVPTTYDEGYDFVKKANDFVVINNRGYVFEAPENPATFEEFVQHSEPCPVARIPEINASYVTIDDGTTTILSYPARTPAPEISKLISPHFPTINIQERGNELIFSGPTSDFGDFKDLATVLNTYDIPKGQIYVNLRIVEWFAGRTYNREQILRLLRDTIEVLNFNLPSNADPTKPLTTGISFDPLNIFREPNKPGVIPRDVYESSIKFLETEGRTHTVASLGARVSNGEPLIFTNQSEIPFPKLAALGNNLVQVPEYQRIGVSFKVTPHANEQGFINLDIEQAESGEQTGNLGPLDTPVFRIASLSSKFTVKDGLTYYIANSLSQRQHNERRGIPGLSKVRIVKQVFGASRTLSQTQSQLLYFLSASKVSREGLEGVEKQ